MCIPRVCSTAKIDEHLSYSSYKCAMEMNLDFAEYSPKHSIAIVIDFIVQEV